MFDWLKNIILGRKIKKIDNILDMFKTNINNRLHLTITVPNGQSHTLQFTDESGTINTELVNGFLGTLRNMALQCISFGFIKDPKRAIDYSLFSMCESMGYNKKVMDNKFENQKYIA